MSDETTILIGHVLLSMLIVQQHHKRRSLVLILIIRNTAVISLIQTVVAGKRFEREMLKDFKDTTKRL